MICFPDCDINVGRYAVLGTGFNRLILSCVAFILSHTVPVDVKGDTVTLSGQWKTVNESMSDFSRVVKAKKDIKEFDWNYKNFSEQLKKGINKEGEVIFKELGYSISFFSSMDEKNSCAFSMTDIISDLFEKLAHNMAQQFCGILLDDPKTPMLQWHSPGGTGKEPRTIYGCYFYFTNLICGKAAVDEYFISPRYAIRPEKDYAFSSRGWRKLLHAGRWEQQ